jgi:plasmid stabilization system protein ParE
VAWQLTFRARVAGHLTAAAGWYEDEDPGLGRRFLNAVDTLVIQIRQEPLRYPSIYRGTRRALVPGFPYAVFFLVRDEAIVVVAVLHTKRDPDNWRLREPAPGYGGASRISRTAPIY